MTKMKMMSIAVLTGFAGAASAQTFQAQYQSFTGGILTIDGEGISAGHMHYTYTGPIPSSAAGQFANQNFSTFCIEANQSVSGAPVTWEVRDISDAPNPVSSNGGVPFGEADESEVHSVVAAAIRLGWINSDLSSNGATDSQLAAIQAGIWDVLFDGSTISSNNGGILTALAALQAEAALDPTARVKGLRAMTSANAQDQLYVVPLPPAALAGLATLGLVAGVSRLRRR